MKDIFNFEKIAADYGLISYTIIDPSTFNSFVYFEGKDTLIFKIKIEALAELSLKFGDEEVESFIRIAINNE